MLLVKFLADSSKGSSIEVAILLQRVRTELDWEFASPYSVAIVVTGVGFFGMYL
jgi:hypothetical protein